MLQVRCRWCDCPADHGPSTTIYNRFNRWSHRSFWLKLLDALADAGVVAKSATIDSTCIKAQRAAFDGKGGAGSRRSVAPMLTASNVSDVKAAPALLERAGRMRYLLADKGYDADRLRRSLRDAGAVPVISGRRNRKRTIRYDKDRHCSRHLIENAFCRLKDFRLVDTRYDKLAANFLSSVAIATAIAFWL
nr:IS5 family transposase [Sphingomonas sp. Leaf257]